MPPDAPRDGRVIGWRRFQLYGVHKGTYQFLRQTRQTLVLQATRQSNAQCIRRPLTIRVRCLSQVTLLINFFVCHFMY